MHYISFMSHSAIGTKFNINESTMYIKQCAFKQKHKTLLFIAQLTKMSIAAHRTQHCISSGNNGSIFANS
jgi:hypothetical protein